MSPTLYLTLASAPCRAVLLLAKSISLDLNVKQLDLRSNETKTPEFLKINPQHTVPTLVDDDGTIVWESHAIMAYLISKYAKNDELYPGDPKTRALVDQRLYFDSGVLFAQILKVIRLITNKGRKSVDQEDKDYLQENYAFVEAFLENRQWIAGNSVTIADFSFITSLTNGNILEKIDPKKYPRISSYLKRAETLAAYEANKQGLKDFEEGIKSRLQ